MMQPLQIQQLIADFLALPPDQRVTRLEELITTVPAEVIWALMWDWSLWARPEQIPPWSDDSWTIFLYMAGRGAGKSRSGAEATRYVVREVNHGGHIGLIAPTAADVRDVMIESPDSGIMGVSPPEERPTYEPTKRRLTWPNGTTATTYSADEPERLRGPQHGWLWCDELGSWRRPEAWDNAMLGLRLGTRPRAMITTTPRPTRLIRALANIRRARMTGDPPADGKDVFLVRTSTHANRPNLPPSFMNEIISRYEGTRIGLQEVYGEILEDVVGAIWSLDEIETANSLDRSPDSFKRIVIGVDPSHGSGLADMCGIIVVGLGYDSHGYILEDRSIRGAPAQWAAQVYDAYRTWNADRIVVEDAFGQKQLAKLVLDQYGNLPIRYAKVHQGKRLRAEPIHSLYEQEKVHHAGPSRTSLHDLETQMTTWVPPENDPDGRGSDFSPDRIDALCLALSDLMLTGRQTVGKISSAADIQIPGGFRLIRGGRSA